MAPLAHTVESMAASSLLKNEAIFPHPRVIATWPLLVAGACSAGLPVGRLASPLGQTLVRNDGNSSIPPANQHVPFRPAGRGEWGGCGKDGHIKWKVGLVVSATENCMQQNGANLRCPREGDRSGGVLSSGPRSAPATAGGHMDGVRGIQSEGQRKWQNLG